MARPAMAFPPIRTWRRPCRSRRARAILPDAASAEEFDQDDGPAVGRETRLPPPRPEVGAGVRKRTTCPRASSSSRRPGRGFE